MATFQAADINTKPLQAGGEGNAVIYDGTANPTAGASGDIIRPTKIPAGTRVTGVRIVNDDLDSNAGPTIAAKVGYSYVDGSAAPAGADTAFAAAGDTVLQSPGNKELRFYPITIEKDAFLEIVLTAAAATFAAGKVCGIVSGASLGAK